MAELALTAIGVDQPGIVARVAAVLRDRGGNVEDSAMTILGGHFAMMLLVETDDDPAALQSAVADATQDLDLLVTVSAVESASAAADPSHVLSVYGSDKPGILAGVTATLADVGANITDLETRVLAADSDPIYAMVIELSLGERDAVAVASALETACTDLGVDHTLRSLEAETY